MTPPFPAFPLGPQHTPEANKFNLFQSKGRNKLQKCYEHSDTVLPTVFSYSLSCQVPDLGPCH